MNRRGFLGVLIGGAAVLAGGVDKCRRCGGPLNWSLDTILQPVCYDCGKWRRSLVDVPRQHGLTTVGFGGGVLELGDIITFASVPLLGPPQQFVVTDVSNSAGDFTIGVFPQVPRHNRMEWRVPAKEARPLLQGRLISSWSGPCSIDAAFSRR
jgi:hypothetical protein